MTEHLRLTKQEQETLNRKCKEINLTLVSKGLNPVRPSELAHLILDHCTDKISVNGDGKFIFEER